MADHFPRWMRKIQRRQLATIRPVRATSHFQLWLHHEFVMSMYKLCGMENALSTDKECWNCHNPIMSTEDLQVIQDIESVINQLPELERMSCDAYARALRAEIKAGGN